MSKNLIFYITIFIFVFSAAFFISDRVSFAADSDRVTYVVDTSDGQHGTFDGQPGFTPFIVNSYISGGSLYQNILILCSGYNNAKNLTGFVKNKASNMSYGGMQCQSIQLRKPTSVTFSLNPSVPVIAKNFSSYAEQESYIGSLIKDPSQIPINVTTYDNSLGSLQLQDSTSWRFLKYEPLSGNPISPTIDGFACKVKLRTMFQDTTTTGQKYDKIQIMVRFKNIRSQFSGIITHPWQDKLQEGEYYSYYLSDLKSPTTVDLQLIDYTKDEDSGKLNKVLYPVFQPAFDKLGLTKPVFSNEYWFICDYTICYRPVTTDGKFGNWFYISPENSALGYNMIGGIKSISATTGIASSDENPSSLSFNPLPEDSTASRTASGRGDTLGDAINDSNNSLIGGSVTSGGSLTSNITDLFELFTNLPSIISTIFAWLPSWVLSLVAIGFALFVPIFIYKFVRG